MLDYFYLHSQGVHRLVVIKDWEVNEKTRTE